MKCIISRFVFTIVMSLSWHCAGVASAQIPATCGLIGGTWNCGSSYEEQGDCSFAGKCSASGSCSIYSSYSVPPSIGVYNTMTIPDPAVNLREITVTAIYCATLHLCLPACQNIDGKDKCVTWGTLPVGGFNHTDVGPCQTDS